VHERGDDDSVEDRRHGERAVGVSLPESLQARPEFCHEDLQALVGLLAEPLPYRVDIEGSVGVGLED
jgi:hypothetical protein